MILSKKQYTSWDNILIPYKSSKLSTVLYSLIRLLEYITPTIQIAVNALLMKCSLRIPFVSGDSRLVNER